MRGKMYVLLKFKHLKMLFGAKITQNYNSANFKLILRPDCQEIRHAHETVLVVYLV